MKVKFIFPILGIFVLAAFGCEKYNDNSDSCGKVELYMLDSYSTIDFSYQIDENTVITENSPLIYYSDFLSYDSSSCIFELSERAMNAIKNLEHSVYGLAFAIKANDTLIYTPYFWPGYSSASCDWIVVDPFMLVSGNKIQVKSGYPGLTEGQLIEDKRNDKRIIKIFKQDHKLI